MTQGEGVAEVPGLDGAPGIFGFTFLGPPSTGVHIAVGIPEDEVFAGVRRDFLVHLGGLGLAAGLALTGSLVFGNLLIRRPVLRILEATRRMAAGDLEARTGLPGRKGELNRLGQAFDEMAAVLAAKQALQKHTEAQLEHQVQERTVSLREEIAERRKVEEVLLQSERELTLRNRIAQIFLTTPDDYAVADAVLQVILEASASRYGVLGLPGRQRLPWWCPP